MKKIVITHIIGLLFELWLIIMFCYPETGLATTLFLCYIFLTQRIKWASDDIKKETEKIRKKTDKMLDELLKS